MGLKLALKVGDTVTIGDALIRLESRSGQRVGLVIEAPRSVSVTYGSDTGTGTGSHGKNQSPERQADRRVG